MQSRYLDARGRWRVAGEDTLVGVLRALGCDVSGPGDAPSALARRRHEVADRRLEPVVVVWRGRPAVASLRLPGGAGRGSVDVSLRPEPGEGGDELAWRVDPSNHAAVVASNGGVAVSLRLPDDLPEGYHRLRVEGHGRADEALVIVAPERSAPPGPRTWGPFVPLYALHGEGGRGLGDVGDLGSLMEWTAALGGGLVATLPLFPTFASCRGPCDPSPYAPVSRLFWNELYVDLDRLPEAQSDGVRALLHEQGIADALRRLRMVKIIDYPEVAAMTDRLLATLVHSLRATPSSRRTAFEAFVRTRPDAVDYARFRAATEAAAAPWRTWPARQRGGRLRPTDAPAAAVDRHLYAQWVLEEQLDDAIAVGQERGVRLLLDLPLGVHADGYDTWREREAFAHDASAGAPPDTFFTRGQNWGFPPLHPERVREAGYRYPIRCLRTLMRRAGVMRIDHMMSQHRLYWIPHGMPATDGAYVRYRAEEWYAILTLESRRSGCALVGEDLGTVPAAVRPAMRRHGLLRTAVVQYEVRPDPSAPLPWAGGAAAAVNTHDMPPFAAFWRGLDIGDRRRRGLLDENGAAAERTLRAEVRSALARFLGTGSSLDDAADVLRALLRHLAAGPADLVLVNLEDLWGEILPQNVPGTGAEEPNWRRRSRRSTRAFGRDPSVVGTLEGLTELRKEASR